MVEEARNLAINKIETCTKWWIDECEGVLSRHIKERVGSEANLGKFTMRVYPGKVIAEHLQDPVVFKQEYFKKALLTVTDKLVAEGFQYNLEFYFTDIQAWSDKFNCFTTQAIKYPDNYAIEIKWEPQTHVPKKN